MQLTNLAYDHPGPDRLFQRMLELNHQHITLLDAQGKIVYANTVEPLLGYSQVEYIKIDPQKLIHPVDQAKAQTFWQTVYAVPNTTKTTELRYRHSLGHYVWVEVTATNLLQDPELRAIFTSSRNLTAQKQVETRYHSLALAYSTQTAFIEQQVAERTATLQTAQNQASAIWNNNPDALLLINPALAIQQANPALQQMFGYTEGDVGVALLDDLVQPDDAPRLRETVRLMFSNQAPNRIELQGRRQDGASFDAEFSFGYMNTTSLIVTARDISLHKRAQRELAEERKRLRTVIDTVPDYIFIKDLQHRFILGNQALATAHGYASPDDLIGKSDFDHFTAKVAEHFQEEEAKILGTGQAMLEHEDLITGQTHYELVLQNKWPLHNLQGELIGLVGIVRNISDSKQRERQLLFDASLQAAAKDAVIATDLKHYIQSWNPAAERIYGWRATEVIGRRIDEILQTQFASAERAEEILQTFWEKGEWADEVIQRHKAGHSLDILTSNVIFKDQAGRYLGIVSINRDISEQKKAAQLLQAKRDEEVEFQKQLQILHEITIELTLIDKLDEFYKQVVQLGLMRLGFERMGLFLYDATKNLAMGTYSTDTAGQLRAEQHLQFTPEPWGGLWKAMQTPSRFYLDKETRLDHDLDAGGHGWNACVALWHGNKNLGWLVADNLIHHMPIMPAQIEIMAQYGMYIAASMARKQAEAALEGQRTFLRKVIDVSPSMIFVKDYNGRFVLVNPKVAEMYNVTVADLLGKSDADFNPSAEEVAHFLEADRKVIASGKQLFLEEPLTNPNGETRWLQTTKVPIVSVDGKSKYVLGVATDITERRQAEEALRHSEKLLRTVIENLPVGVWLLDLAGMITQANPAGKQIWQGIPNVGLKELANVYKAWWADTGKLLRNEEWADVRALVQGETTLNQELEIEAFDGIHKYILSSAIPIRDAQQKVQGAIVVNQDITERKQNEKLIRQALEKEKELGELKSRFVSMASHEFRTPLATILALTDTLATYWPKLTELQIQQRFDKIKTQIAHLKSIMEDMLQLARIQAKRVEFQPVQFNLDELCRKIIDEFQVQLKLEQQIEYQCADDTLYTIHADPKLLRQIISNLLSNAIKYSPTGKPVQINLHYAEKKLILAVRDEGIGIPKADLPHLFEPFHRAGNVGTISGTGLGMVITKEAIELHGGSISVQSEIGVGSTFTVRLPITQPTTA